MKTLSGNRFFLFNLLLVFLLSCTKEGDVGPQGLEGLSGTKIYTGNAIPATTLGIAGDFYFQLTNSDFYGPKTTTGWGDPVNLRGATGAVGATGLPGTTGAPGAPGTPGSQILNGTTAPANNLGQIGDYYLNRSNTDLYGPKTASGWGIALNLKGANGTKIYNGTAAPATGLGINGDYYFRSTTGQLYGPKTDAGWGTPISLIGAKGADGTNGTNGTNGATILAGTTVPVMGIGNLGDFYFRSNTGDFYGPKTATTWGNATSLKGTNGLNGAPGSQILSGITVPPMSLGRIGDFYFRTNTSDFYGPKTATTWGTPVNLKGATGAAGSNGSPGSKIHNGYGNPQDTLGRAGDYYISIATGNLFGPKTGSGWGSPIMNLRGPAGPQTDVIYSEWRTLYGSYQSPSSGNISGEFFVPEFKDNPDLLDEAAVLVYIREDAGEKGSFISQLNCKGRLYDWVDYSFYLDQTNAAIRILISNTGFDIGRKEVEDNLLFRFVIIPGNKNAQGLAKALPKDYNQLKVMYKIAD